MNPRRRLGFGSRLIDGLSAETNGNVSLKFERDGVVWLALMSSSQDADATPAEALA